MATTFDRLVTAGAPAIREPYFYRVTEPTDGRVRVEVRKRNERFGSTRLGRSEAQLDPAHPEANLGTVIAAAQSAVAAVASRALGVLA